MPCRIKHTGAANASQKHWEVTTEENGSKTAYFRGRKLVGKDIKLPTGYSGGLL
jgi:ribonuclease H2 subunit C